MLGHTLQEQLMRALQRSMPGRRKWYEMREPEDSHLLCYSGGLEEE